jgi:hypothetical protein
MRAGAMWRTFAVNTAQFQLQPLVEPHPSHT